MKNETNLLYPQDAYWNPKKSDTVGDRYDICDKLKRVCIVFDGKTGKKLKRCGKTARKFVYSTDTVSIKEYRAKTRDYNGVHDVFGNDELEIVIAYDGVDLIWDEERKCFYDKREN